MKYNIFSSFEEAKESQNYDHLFQKAFDLSTTSGVAFSTIRELNLHIQDSDGNFPLDSYIAENNIVVEFPEIYEHAKTVWKLTTGWAIIFAYDGQFVYRKDHSDRIYPIVEIEDSSFLLPIDSNGEILPTAAIPFNPYVPDEAANG